MFKMANFFPILFSILILHATSKAAPNKNHAFISKSIEESPKLDSEPYGIAENINNENARESIERQKRYYDYIGFPPLDFSTNFPFSSRPNYIKRDDSQNTAVYGADNSLMYILRRLQEIVGDARRQSQVPPSNVAIPAYIPIFYLPPVNCACPPNNDHTPSPPINNNNNMNNKPANTPATQNNSTTIPNLDDRVMGLNEPGQNWGILVNNTVSNDFDDGNDGRRPISLDPIVPQEPLDIPVPPVEHGSVQAGAEPVTSTLRPVPDQRFTTTLRTLNQRPVTTTFRPPPEIADELDRPSLCDAAVIKCCVRSPVTYNCFSREGCPDPSFSGNPCDPKVFYSVADKIQAYIKKRSGNKN